MDLYRIALVFLGIALLAVVGILLLLWREGRRDTRLRERQAREALDRANKDVSARPRVPAIVHPNPTLQRIK